jgi:predicted PurR-regulated permease PerM
MNWPTEALVGKKIPRAIAAITSHIVILGAAVLTFYLLVPALASEIKNLAVNNSQYLEEVWDYAKSENSSIYSYLEPTIGSFGENFTDTIGSILGIFGSILSFGIIFFVSLVANMQKNGIHGMIALFVPSQRKAQVESVYQKIQSRVNSWVWGRIAVSALTGGVVFVGLSIIGIPNAAILATLAFFLDFVVYVGPVLAAIPAIILGLSISPMHAVAVTALYIFINGVLDNFVFTPLLMKKAVHVSPAIIILLVALGGALGGPLGIVIAIPTAAIIQVLLEESWKQS